MIADVGAIGAQPGSVVAVSSDVVSGVPAEISTSYVERRNSSLRMCRAAASAATGGRCSKKKPLALREAEARETAEREAKALENYHGPRWWEGERI